MKTLQNRQGELDNLLSILSIGGATFMTWMINNGLGLVIGLGGLAVQIYFNRRKDKREERELSLKEKQYNDKHN